MWKVLENDLLNAFGIRKRGGGHTAMEIRLSGHKLWELFDQEKKEE